MRPKLVGTLAVDLTLGRKPVLELPAGSKVALLGPSVRRLRNALRAGGLRTCGLWPGEWREIASSRGHVRDDRNSRIDGRCGSLSNTTQSAFQINTTRSHDQSPPSGMVSRRRGATVMPKLTRLVSRLRMRARDSLRPS